MIGKKSYWGMSFTWVNTDSFIWLVEFRHSDGGVYEYSQRW